MLLLLLLLRNARSSKRRRMNGPPVSMCVFFLQAITKIIDQPKELLNVLGETVPLVAVYFINLIIVKVITGLLLELCFGGRSLKFWRILIAETFTDPG